MHIYLHIILSPTWSIHVYIYDISLKLTVFSNNPTCSALSTKPWSSLGSRDGETARTSTRRTSICHHLASKQQTFLAKQFFNFSISWSQDFLPWLGFSFNLVWFSNDYVHNSYRSGTRLTSSKIKNPPHRSEKCHPHAKSQGFSALMNRICRWNSSYYLNRSPARWRWGGALGIWSRLATSPDRFFWYRNDTGHRRNDMKCFIFFLNFVSTSINDDLSDLEYLVVSFKPGIPEPYPDGRGTGSCT